MGMFSQFWRNRDVARSVEAILDTKLRESVTALSSIDVLVSEKAKLAEDVHMLSMRVKTIEAEIEGERAEMERDRLEVEHRLGLEELRQRQEAELAQNELDAQRKRMDADQRVAVKEAQLEARQVAAEEARQQMALFLDRQERMIDNLLGALPKAELFQRTGVPDVKIG